MSSSVAVNYTNDLFSTFSVIRKKDYISEDKKNRISKIEVNPSGIICAITAISINIAIIAISVFSIVPLAFIPLVNSAFLSIGSGLDTLTFFSTIREIFAESRSSDSIISV